MIKSIINGDSNFVLDNLPTNFVDLIITSPPYNAGHEYDIYDDNKIEKEYLDILKSIFKKCFNVLKDDGKMCINVPFAIKNMKTKKVSFLATKIADIVNEIGFKDFEMITWHKGENINHFQGNNTAWGSWKSPSCPNCRPMCEAIMVFYKNEKSHRGEKDDIDITADEFKTFTKNSWYFKDNDVCYHDLICESNNSKKSDHPAPYPVALIERIIKMYSYKNDIVLDPFNGIGTTTIAAAKTNRQYIGIELSEKYVNLTLEKMKEFDPNFFVYSKKFENSVNSDNNENTLNYFFPYKESFSPRLLELLYNSNIKSIYDPFVGTGSTFCSSICKDAICIGCDTSPLSKEITLAKLVKLDNFEIKEVKNKIEKFTENDVFEHVFPNWEPYSKYVDKDKYDIVQSFIDYFKSCTENAFRFIKYLIISNLQTFFDYKRDGNGIKYRKSKIDTSDAVSTLKSLCFQAISMKEQFDQDNSRVLSINNCSSMLFDLPESIDLVLTSPPYCNMFDYFEVYKIELWTSGLINNYDEWKRFKKTAMRSNLNSNVNSDKPTSTILLDRIEKLRALNESEKTIKMINNYFYDFNELLLRLKKSISKKTKLFVVVGNSFYSGVSIPTDEIICELAKNNLLCVDKIIVARKLATSSQQLKILANSERIFLRESIVVLGGE